MRAGLFDALRASGEARWTWPRLHARRRAGARASWADETPLTHIRPAPWKLAVKHRPSGQIPMQRVQYRRNRAAGCGQDGGPERFEMVMDKIDVDAVPQPGHDVVHVGGGNPHYLVVRFGEVSELRSGKYADLLVDFDCARGNGCQDNMYAVSAKLRDERGDHALDAAIALWRHRKPRTRVDQNGARHGLPSLKLAARCGLLASKRMDARYPTKRTSNH